MENTALDLMRWAKKELEDANVPSATGDAEILFMDSFGARREDIYLMDDFKPAAHRLNHFKRYIKLRASRYPLQYILKSAEFTSLPFLLEEGIFIPRPETELLVEKVLEYIKSLNKRRIDPVRNIKDTGLKSKISSGVIILEIGTGCGNIAISLTKNVTGCRIIASDISNKALRVAAGNAQCHGTRKKIKFIKSNIFDNISDIYWNYFDIIIANPPYVCRGDIEHLQPEVSHEDVIALDGGKDGLYFYRRIFNEGARYLKKGGIFALEIGYNQAKDIAGFIKNDGRFSETAFFKDYSGYDRVVITKYGDK